MLQLNEVRIMDWTSCFIKSINYIEEHLLEKINVEDIADAMEKEKMKAIPILFP